MNAAQFGDRMGELLVPEVFAVLVPIRTRVALADDSVSSRLHFHTVPAHQGDPADSIKIEPFGGRTRP